MTDGSRDLAHLRRLALTTLFPGFEGTTRPPGWLTGLVAEGLGGVVLFGRNIDPELADDGVAVLVATLRAAGPDLLVAIDEEGGDVTRLDVAHGSLLPGNAALGALDDPATTADVAAELGARLRACGIDVNFAPVADVDVNAGNPVIGVRAFGVDAGLVARHVGAFVTGQQSQGVAAAAKHFPGHGATAEDSHLTVPVLHASRELLDRRELVPFRAAITANAQVVMTAHIRVPAVDPTWPGTLSPEVIDGLLRRELGFDGVVMTDGLDMHAISHTVGHAEAAVLALLAGVDGLCIGGESTDAATVEAMAAAIVDAVLTRRLPYSRLVEAAGRVRRLQEWAHAPVAGRPGTGPGRPGLPATVPVGGAAERAARRAVTGVGDVTLAAAPLVIELRDEPSIAAGDIPWGVGQPLTVHFPDTVVVSVVAGRSDIAEVLARHPGRRVIVAVRGVRRRAWQVATVAAIRASRPDVIVVDHDVASPAEVLGEHHVLAHGAARVTAEAAADLLAGRLGSVPDGAAR